MHMQFKSTQSKLWKQSSTLLGESLNLFSGWRIEDDQKRNKIRKRNKRLQCELVEVTVKTVH